jgi:DNA-binding Lrp family transcriptional regulator
MDALDRKILAELQADGRISITDLADRVGLSLSAAHRRVRELEQSKAIEGYRAIVSPSAVDLGFETIVFVTISRTDLDTIEAFEKAVMAIPSVLDAERLFGDPDYLLRVVTRDLASYQELYDNVLGRLPGVQRASSTLVMKRLRTDRMLPVG